MKVMRLVIDASIARAASNSEHPTPKNCRDFLEAFLTNGHKAVMSPDLQEEWQRHRSNFTQIWRRRMYARKLWVVIDPCTDDALRNKIENCGQEEEAITAMIKDTHLLEAALATDKFVFALDDKARNYFKIAAKQVGLIREIGWLNPNKEHEVSVSWLAGEIDQDAIYRLGYVPTDA